MVRKFVSERAREEVLLNPTEGMTVVVERDPLGFIVRLIDREGREHRSPPQETVAIGDFSIQDIVRGDYSAISHLRNIR